MSLTLRSLQTDMRDSFAKMSVRIDTVDTKIDNLAVRVDNLEIKVDNLATKVDNLEIKVDNLETNVNERIDNLSRTLDAHIKETAYFFRQVDQRFDRLLQDITTTFSPYFFNIEKMLSNHEERITTLEQTR